MRSAIGRRGNFRPDIKDAQAVINGGTISRPHLRVMQCRVQIPCNGLWSFARKADAQKWLDTEATANLASGTYVPPRAGAMTVAEVYASWSTSQGHISAKTAATRKSAWHTRVEPRWGKVALAA
jgi:hypothetical protein